MLLEPPAQSQFAFPVLSGVREEQTEAQRREHVRAFLQVQEDMGYLAKEISEVDTTDLENIRIVSQMERRGRHPADRRRQLRAAVPELCESLPGDQEAFAEGEGVRPAVG